MIALPALARRSFPAGLAVAALAAALGLGGCKTSCSSCHPPSEMATAQPCDPPPMAACPAPCAPPRAAPPCSPPAPSAMPPPAPPPAAVSSADDDAQMRTLHKTIELQRQQLDLQRKEMERLSGDDKAKAAALDEAKRSRLGGEDAAQRLAEELRGVPGASVLVEGSKVSVIVTDCFDSGSDRLKPNPDVRAALRAASAAILRHPEARVSVVGHTDSKPINKSHEKWQDNVALSRARAEVVAKALCSDGIKFESLQVAGRGSGEMLVVPEKTAADRARNRRVEVQFDFAS